MSALLLPGPNEQHVSGTLLGTSLLKNMPVIISDHDINQILLVLGTTGSGKTVTLRRFYERAIVQGYPLIIVDGKPRHDNVDWIVQLSEQHRRLFYGFNCQNQWHYDPLAHGGFTELKDKIISLKDIWESDYYRSIAEDYLQTLFEVLLKRNRPFDLETVSECLDFGEFALLARETKCEPLMQRVAELSRYDQRDITGLHAHLNILVHSELGDYFRKNESTFNLRDAIDQNGVVYFALPALRFPSFSKVLGKLVINDLKAVIDRQNQEKRIFIVFDEFSVFAGEQVLNLVNMGREKGVHAILGTQGLSDLRKVDEVFEHQIVNCANTLICHRINDQEDAEKIAQWVGTQDGYQITTQVNISGGKLGMGTLSHRKEFIIHPDQIKQSLQPGEAFYITKVGGFRWDKVKVIFS